MANEKNENIIIGDLEGQIDFYPSLPIGIKATILKRQTREPVVMGFFGDEASARAWLEVEMKARSQDFRRLI
jgi:hypothetical protein